MAPSHLVDGNRWSKFVWNPHGIANKVTPYRAGQAITDRDVQLLIKARSIETRVEITEK